MKVPMYRLSRLVSLVGLFGLIGILNLHAAVHPPALTNSEQKSRSLSLKLPLSFEQHNGQAGASEKFVARAPGFTLLAMPSEMVTLIGASSPSHVPAVIHTQLKGAKRSAPLRGEDPQSGKSNYLVGNDPSKWIQNASHYARVRQAGVYPGVDLIYHGDNSALEYDFVVAPGADPTQIKLTFSGPDKIVIDANGDLKLITDNGELTQRKPVVYQQENGEKRYLPGEYVRIGKREVRFKIGTYDRTKELVIDPVVDYATYLGGSGNDRGQALAVDNNGNAYIAGITNSADFPVASPIKATNASNANLMFVSKINTNTNTLVYSTYLGGVSSTNTVYAIALDTSGAAHITGESFATDFPIVGGFQTTNAGGSDVILAKLNSAGNALAFSTYLGGSSNDTAFAIALDGSGNAYLTGNSSSTDFPLQNAYQTSPGSPFDAFVSKINLASKALSYSTYLGGDFHDTGYGITVDSLGHAYVVGETQSANFPTTGGAYRTAYTGTPNGFAAKFAANGQSLDYATLLGEPLVATLARAAKLNSAGELAIVGKLPGGACLPNSDRVGTSGSENGFLIALNSSGSALTVNSCIVGGPLDDLAVGTDGFYYVSGVGNNSIVVSDTVTVPPYERFILKLTSDGKTVKYAKSVNPGDGFFHTAPHRIAVDSTSHAYMTGMVTVGNNLAVSAANLGASLQGTEDSFLVKVAPTLPSSVNLIGPSASIAVGQPAIFTATVSGASSGNVIFKSDTATLASQPLIGSVASFSTTALPIGTSNITAYFDGGENTDSSKSSSVTVVTTKAKPVARLDMSSTDPDPGDHVTATVTVTGGSNPTGTVTFRVDGEIRATSFLASTGPTSGVARAEFAPQGNGIASGDFEATYSGDENNQGATTNAIRVTSHAGILGGVGGGCTIGSNSRDLLLPIMLMLALFGLWYRRTRMD